MNNRRLLYLTLIVATLSIGVIIGSIVSGGVKATTEQKAATLVIPDPVSLSNAFSQIASQLGPSVVTIRSEANAPEPTRQQQQRRRGQGQNPQQNPFGGILPPDFFDFFGGPDGAPDQRSRSLGTGFIVDKGGYILTNHHVVDKADKIKVVLDDKSEFNAKLIGSDDQTDLAVIKIDVGHELPVAKLGNSDAVKTGDWVLAIGSPFEFDHTVTAGIISAKGREARNSGLGPSQFQSFLQTDAAINPGNSGGPLVNMQGEVIGINTAIVSETRQFAGLGFALPSNTAVKIYNQLVQSGKVTRGSIGISYKDDPSVLRAFGLKPGDGVLVEDVFPDGPAAKAGVRPNDVVTDIDGAKITSGGMLLDIIANSPVGRTINVKLLRDGRSMTVPIVLGDRSVVIREDQQSSNRRPDAPGGGGESAETKLGITVEPITNEMVRRFGLSGTDGVIVTDVQRGSAAEDAGFQEEMVITGVVVGGQRIDIHGIADFRKAQQALKPGADAAFSVLLRNPQTGQYRRTFLSVTIP